ncbi:MAG: 3-dehydroquinate synthase [Eubacteriales bacterium]|nr:3-dehydroquinate synthase [Eubacteriales bacterium]
MILKMNLIKEKVDDSYDIVIEKDILKKAKEYFNLNRKTLIVIDDLIPKEYVEILSKQIKDYYVFEFKHGEDQKNITNYNNILSFLLKENFSRNDCIISLGGGVCGDMACFAASSYMRGIDFYNIPTTLLSQIDSSIGGKCAINLDGYKNIVGAFYQPKKVLIDSNLLHTLPKRQVLNGLAEAIKMSITSDKQLFELIEKEDYNKNINLIIEKSLKIKKQIVEKDEKELNLRKILNYGHTIGHAIESKHLNKHNLYHGECISIGMLLMCNKNISKRIKSVLEKVNLPTNFDYDTNDIINVIKHDKKFHENKITICYVEEIGNAILKDITIDELTKIIEDYKKTNWR